MATKGGKKKKRRRKIKGKWIAAVQDKDRASCA